MVAVHAFGSQSVKGGCQPKALCGRGLGAGAPCSLTLGCIVAQSLEGVGRADQLEAIEPMVLGREGCLPTLWVSLLFVEILASCFRALWRGSWCGSQSGFY